MRGRHVVGALCLSVAGGLLAGAEGCLLQPQTLPDLSSDDGGTRTLGDCLPACDTAAGERCVAGTCVSCKDGVKNGDETDVDCGGACGACDLGRVCSKSGDCSTGHCADGLCCSDACDNGDCWACNVGGFEGVCVAVPSGEAHAACEGASACDGAGGCKKASLEDCAVSSACASGRCVSGKCI